MTASEIITKFELQVDDATELSTSEELYILNRVYRKVCLNRPWEFLRKGATGSVATDGEGTYISFPADFGFFSQNANYTDNTIENQSGSAPVVVYIYANGVYTPYRLINYPDRVKYLGKAGFVYVDLINSKIRFTAAPISGTYQFDYYYIPTDLTANDTPVIPARFQDILVFGMSVHDNIVKLSPKATSYLKENQVLYEDMLADLAYWNSQFIFN